METGVKTVGSGVSELRFDCGPGYRVYLTQRGLEVVILLASGDKRTQSKDMEAAIEMAKQLEETAMTELKLKKWDVVEQLKTDEDMALYLDACMEEDPGDGSLIRAALGDVARAKGMSQLARDTGLAREGLYKALSAEGNPEFSTIMKVMRALGVKLHVEAG